MVSYIKIGMHAGRIFGPKKDKNGGWRRLHNEERHSLYGSPNISKGINLEK